MTGGRLGLLLVTAAALSGYLVWSGDAALILPMLEQLKSPRAQVQPAALGQATPGAPALSPVVNPVSSLKPEDLAEMVQRPLFNPGRAPPVPPVEDVAQPVEEAPPEPEVEDTTGAEDFTLLAVASRDGVWTAVVRLNKTNEVAHIKQGDAMSEWQFTGADSREITLSNAGKTIQLKLFQDLGNRPAPDMPQQPTEDGDQVQEQ